jgi:tocopherol O-methyltransferase
VIVPNHPQDAAAVAGHYDELDQFYREVWGNHVHHGLWRTGQESPRAAVEQLVRFLARELRLQRGQTVCDVGCGYGASAELLSMEYGVKVVGVTLSQRQLEVGRAEVIRSEPEIELRCMDWLENDFPPGNFDALYAIESTEHMADKQRFFDEAQRTMKSGGRLGVYAWLHRPNPSRREARHLLEPICREGRLAGMGTADEYLAMAEKAGFEIIAGHDLSRQVARTWSICLRRMLGKLFSDGRYLRYLLDPAMKQRVFALTVLRILAAYRLGAMQYGLLVARKR